MTEAGLNDGKNNDRYEKNPSSSADNPYVIVVANTACCILYIWDSVDRRSSDIGYIVTFLGCPIPRCLYVIAKTYYIVRNGTDMPFDEIRRKLAPLLEDYKIPAAFDWIDEIPKTSSGKKQRLSLRNP